MKLANLATLVGVAALMLGCGNLERSRDLANPSVSATTLAQQVCSNCHGLTGVAVSPNFPNLAGQVEAYVVAQLKEFKSHSRQDPAGFEYMWGLSRSLTEDQITGLAAYYARQPAARQSVEGDPTRLAPGQSITVFEGGIPSSATLPP